MNRNRWTPIPYCVDTALARRQISPLVVLMVSVASRIAKSFVRVAERSARDTRRVSEKTPFQYGLADRLQRPPSTLPTVFPVHTRNYRARLGAVSLEWACEIRGRFEFENTGTTAEL